MKISMNFRGHFISGLAVTVILNVYFYRDLSIKSMAFFSVLAVFASLLPDLDHPNSRIHRYLYGLSPVFSAYIVLQRHPDILEVQISMETLYKPALEFLVIAAIAIVLVFLGSKLKHRGITHSFPGAVIIGILGFFGAIYAGFEPWVLMTYLIGGYLTHLVLDRISTWFKRQRPHPKKR